MMMYTGELRGCTQGWPRKVFRGLRRRECREQFLVCYQDTQAGEEEKDQERDQDTAEPMRRTEYYQAAGYCA